MPQFSGTQSKALPIILIAKSVHIFVGAGGLQHSLVSVKAQE